MVDDVRRQRRKGKARRRRLRPRRLDYFKWDAPGGEAKAMACSSVLGIAGDGGAKHRPEVRPFQAVTMALLLMLPTGHIPNSRKQIQEEEDGGLRSPWLAASPRRSNPRPAAAALPPTAGNGRHRVQPLPVAGSRI
jgi:hypothetical protein